MDWLGPFSLLATAFIILAVCPGAVSQDPRAALAHRECQECPAALVHQVRERLSCIHCRTLLQPDLGQDG